MAKMITTADTNYRKGMNSLDDPKALQDGEAVEIVNAFPAYPLRMRKGCNGRCILSGSYPLGVSYTNRYGFSQSYYANIGGRDYLLFWIGDPGTLQSGRPYRLCYVLAEKNNSFEAIEILKYTGDYRTTFAFTKIREIVYVRTSDGRMYAIEEVEGKVVEGIHVGLDARRVPAAGFNTGIAFNNSSFRIVPAITFPGGANGANGTFGGYCAFGYSATYIRRPDYRLDDPYKIEHAYIPGLIETPEDPLSRGSVTFTALSNVVLFVKPTINITPDNEYGFTHVRIYRTDNLYSVPDEIAGAERSFLMDIPIASFYANNGSPLPSLSGITDDNILLRFEDSTTPDALLGEMNKLQADMYTLPPPDGYRMLWFKNRLFLMGKRGMVYYSEIPGGGGEEDVEFAQTEGAKYALWFKPLTYRLDLDVEEQTASTGIDYYGDDLYLFKENKVYMIIGGDPLLSPLRTVNDKTGCPFPDTITRAIIDGREVLFYLSNTGPMLIFEGGNSRPFTEFKVKELWPNAGGGVFAVLQEAQWCTAAFWNNTLWIFYRFDEGDTKIFGYLSTDEASGAFEVRLAEFEHMYLINNIVITNDNRAVTVAPTTYPRAAFVDFLSNEESYDTYRDYGEDVSRNYRPNFSLLSRKHYPGPQERSISELFRFVAHCDFRENRVEDTPFYVDIASNRFRAHWDYYERTGHSPIFQNNQLGAPVKGSSYKDWFNREDGRTWPPNTFTGWLAYLYHEDFPDNGIWVNVKGNGDTQLEFDTAVGMQNTHVRLIAKPVIRRNISFTARADFAGEFFQYEITKIIPIDRQFNLYGAELEAIPRPQLDIENLVGTDLNHNVWE